MWYRMLFSSLFTHKHAHCSSLCLCVGSVNRLFISLLAYSFIYIHSLLWFCWHMLYVYDRLIGCLHVYSQNKSISKQRMNWHSIVHTCSMSHRLTTHFCFYSHSVNTRTAKQKSYDKLIVWYTNAHTHTQMYDCMYRFIIAY